MTNRYRVVRRLGWMFAAVLVCIGIGTGTEKAPAAEEGVNQAEVGPRPNPVPTPSAEAIDGSIRRGVDFLLADQNRNGSWGMPRASTGADIYVAVPGSHHAFRTAVTSLCIMALIDCGDSREEVARAIDRAEAWLFKHLPALRRAGPVTLYNNWGHAYSIQALARMVDRKPHDKKRRERIKRFIEQQIEMLGRYECVDGGWCYYDMLAQTKQPSGSSISFVTASVLVAFAEAKRIGVEVPERLVRRAMDSIRRQRKPDFSYCYGEYLKYYPMFDGNRPGGSLGRSQACNLAMYVWDDEKTTQTIMKTWLDRLAARNLWLDIGRKRPIPHESWFKVSGYFFYYGHFYAALCIEQLEPTDQPHFQDHLAHILLRVQEKDGSWWDFPMFNYHKPYGTAFAVMSLVRCRRASE